MNCERCGNNPGTIRYTEVGDGETKKLQICEDCAAVLGFEIGGEITEPKIGNPADVSILGLVSAEETPEKPDTRRCTTCGLTGTEYGRSSLFGCPDCYEAFEEGLEPLLKRLHAAVAHRGRLPGGRIVEPPDLPALRRQLREAIRNEDFDAAAKVRDRLRQAGVRDLDEKPGEDAP